MFSDEDCLRMTFSLAKMGEGETNPNPIVGALIVNGGRVVGRGFHRKAGEKHAEIAALDEAGEAAKGATLYLNLEPCCHQGKTPPCSARILSAGIKRVVCPMKDPNPLVDGKGFGALRAGGINVEEGLLEEEARRLNEVFLKFIRTGKPFITAKAAMSLDGKIATAGGESQWISSQGSRKYIHDKIRFNVDAILVGINTVLHDDPLLTARGRGARKKKLIRIVLDSNLRTPPDSKLISSIGEGYLWIYTTAAARKESREKLERAGARILTVGAEEGRCRMDEVIEDIGRMNVPSLLIEGGSRTLASAFRGKHVDKLFLFIAPIIIGDGGSVPVIGDIALRELGKAIRLDGREVLPIDGDVMYKAYPCYQ